MSCERSGWPGLDADPTGHGSEPRGDLVIDCSAILKSALAGRLADFAVFDLHAPSLLWSEAASGLSQLRWRGEISTEASSAALTAILGHPIDIVPSRELTERAVAIAIERGWAKTYDAEYLALAERLNARLLTADARLRRTSIDTVAIVGPLDVLGP